MTREPDLWARLSAAVRLRRYVDGDRTRQRPGRGRDRRQRPAARPYSGGSGLATSLSGAIHDAAGKLLARSSTSPRRVAAAGQEPGRRHRGRRLHPPHRRPLDRGDIPELLAGHGLPSDRGRRGEPAGDRCGPAALGSFAACFAEVRVDEDLGLLRVTRIISAVDAGRVLNEKLARSQIIGGVVMGIGMTLFEETVFDPATGRIANPTFADYLIPASADVPDLDVSSSGARQVRPSGSRASARSASSACPPPSPTPCTTPPADASDRCRSPSNSCCKSRRAAVNMTTSESPASKAPRPPRRARAPSRGGGRLHRTSGSCWPTASAWCVRGSGCCSRPPSASASSARRPAARRRSRWPTGSAPTWR